MRLLAERLRTPFQVFSAGTSAVAGSPVPEFGVVAAKERGVDLSKKTATPLTRDLVERADRILVMESRHLHGVAAVSRSALERVTVVTDLAAKPPTQGIPDPYGGTLDDYRRCYDTLHSVLAEGLPRLIETADRNATGPGRDPA